MGNILVADMRHYLGPDLGIIELPGPAAKLRDHLGSIVEAVTSGPGLEQNDCVRSVRCRRRPGHRRCEGEIIACFDEAEPSAIKWFCPFCGDGGYIRGWQGTAWDRRGCG
jgi:hypothetical protein